MLPPVVRASKMPFSRWARRRACARRVTAKTHPGAFELHLPPRAQLPSEARPGPTPPVVLTQSGSRGGGSAPLSQQLIDPGRDRLASGTEPRLVKTGHHGRRIQVEFHRFYQSGVKANLC